MPTQKYRMSVTLDDDVRATLARLSAALDIPGPTFVAALLRDSLPSLLELADVAEAAAAGRKGSLAGLKTLLDSRIEAAHTLSEGLGGYDACQ